MCSFSVKHAVFRRKNKDWLNWRIRKTIQYIMLFNNWVLLKEITQHTLYFHFTLTIVVISQCSTFFISSNRWRHALLINQINVSIYLLRKWIAIWSAKPFTSTIPSTTYFTTEAGITIPVIRSISTPFIAYKEKKQNVMLWQWNVKCFSALRWHRS